MTGFPFHFNKLCYSNAVVSPGSLHPGLIIFIHQQIGSTKSTKVEMRVTRITPSGGEKLTALGGVLTTIPALTKITDKNVCSANSLLTIHNQIVLTKSSGLLYFRYEL
jgi:hypothetical protein